MSLVFGSCNIKDCFMFLKVGLHSVTLGIAACFIGHFLYFEYFSFFSQQKCVNEHEGHKWSSQPRLASRGVNAGDFMLASSILLSGNHHAKVALLMKALGMSPMTRTFFFQVQSLYCFPAITVFWGRMLEHNHDQFPGGVVDCAVGKWIYQSFNLFSILNSIYIGHDKFRFLQDFRYFATSKSLKFFNKNLTIL